MASITSMVNGSSSLSSIYGNRNILSGLASGMDTESMIENAVSGIKLKIQNLTKKRTKVEWQQEAYRSIIDKAVNFNTKYTSYSSKTNLLSSSFFSNAVNTAVLGTYANKITATGKTSSDIKINAVKQMASAASYTVSGLGGKFTGEISGITGREEFDLTKDLDVSTVSGSLTFQYGGKNGASFTINFDELENLNEVEVLDADGNVKTDATNAEKMAQAIRNKLSEVTYTYTKNGFQETTTADQAIKVTANEDGRITFTDGLGNGNSVKISSSTGDMEKYAGENVIVVPKDLTKEVPTYEYLGGTKGDDGQWSGGKELSVTYNGTTKKINMSDIMNKIDFTYAAEDKNTQFQNALQEQLDKEFGAGKIEVGKEGGKLTFTPTGSGDTMSIGGSAVKALGFESGDSNYINAGKKLSDLLDDDIFSDKNKIDVTKDTTLESLMNSINSSAEAGVKVSYSKLTNEFKFTASQTGASGRIEFGGLAKDMFVTHDREASDSFADTYGLGLSDGQSKRFAFSFEGRDLSFEISSGDSMQDVADRLNMLLSNYDQTASYDELTGQIMVTDKTGKMVDFELYEGQSSSSGTKLDRPEFESSFTSGQDAVMDVEINGKRFEDLTRSTNTFDLDGLSVNVKGTFDAVGKDGEDYEPITFNTTTDADKIVEAIKSFVDDYNEMATELKSAYSTMPTTKSDGSRYDPLTAEQEEQYSESELKAYNEKAKQGILFGDSTLSSFYSKLLSAITPGGTDGQTLREIGIGTSYSDGMTTLSLDEDKLRAALESDPDKVKNAFTKSKEGGSSSDGLMQTMQNTLNTYVKTTGEPKGVLITRAGSTKAPTSLNSNSLKSQMDSIDKQIDRYTTQFSRLEQLIAEMNSQSSAFAGLMGGSSGY